MDFEKRVEFDKYIESYKKLKLNDKKALAINELNRILGLLNNVIEEHNIKSQVLYNREILDVIKKESNEEDFVEAIYVYIHSIQELIANYIELVETKLGGNI